MATFRIGIPTSRSPTSIGGRIGASLFYLVFAGMGVVVAGFFAVAMKNGMVSWAWERAQCRVLAAQVDELLFTLPAEKAAVESDPYQLAVTYQWERDGRVFNGTHVGGKSQFSTRARAEAALARYAPETTVSCYVNPHDPNEAALRRPRLWPLLVLGVPLLFVGFGVAGIVATWRGGWRRESAGVDVPRSQRSAKGGRGCAVAAFSLFAIFGGAFLLLFVLPIVRKLASYDWEVVPATIVWSGVGSHSGDDSTTYSAYADYNNTNRANIVLGNSGNRNAACQKRVCSCVSMPSRTLSRTVIWLKSRMF